MFQLAIKGAKRNFFPVPRKDKKTGEIVIDKETGLPKIDMIPGSYSISFNDGHRASVTRAKVKTGEKDDKGRDIYKKIDKISVSRPGAPITNCFGRDTGKNEPEIKVLDAAGWKKFTKAYNHCGMPQLVLEGMEQADEELAERRA